MAAGFVLLTNGYILPGDENVWRAQSEVMAHSARLMQRWVVSNPQ